MKEDRVSSQPIFLVSTAPPKWSETMLPGKQKETVRQEANTALVIPIHNEQTHIESVLGMLCLNRGPISRVFLVLNGCTDATKDKILSWFKLENNDHFGNRVTLPKGLDPSIIGAHQLEAFGINWSIIETEKPGKSNAITIAAHLAMAEQFGWLVNIDANNYLEPDALANLTHKIAAISSDTVVINGSAKTIRPGKIFRDRVKSLLGRSTPLREYTHTTKGVEILGNLHAINLEWFHTIGRIPDTVVEDFSLAVLAASQGKRILHTEDSFSWGYSPIGYKDRIRTYARYTQGFFQTMRLFPDQIELIKTERSLVRPWHERAAKHIKQLAEHRGLRKLAVLENIIVSEIGRIQGVRRDKSDLKETTWLPINSTKK